MGNPAGSGSFLDIFVAIEKNELIFFCIINRSKKNLFGLFPMFFRVFDKLIMFRMRNSELQILIRILVAIYGSAGSGATTLATYHVNQDWCPVT